MATSIEIALDNSVAANTTDIQTSGIIANGREVILKEFSGSALGNDYCVVQWGSGAAWTTIRASYGTFRFPLTASFVGDGAKRFRVLRINSDLSTSRRIFIHISALVRDGG